MIAFNQMKLYRLVKNNRRNQSITVDKINLSGQKVATGYLGDVATVSLSHPVKKV